MEVCKQKVKTQIREIERMASSALRDDETFAASENFLRDVQSYVEGGDLKLTRDSRKIDQ